MLKKGILEERPDVDVVIRSTDLSVPENAYQFYEGLKDYGIETWVNNAGFGNYDSVANQDLGKIGAMLHLNIEALTILSSHNNLCFFLVNSLFLTFSFLHR